jgi:MYXO-CTERM domain-containing protein
VLTYYIDPTISNDLKRISTPNGNTPRFTSIMAATSAGSQVVLYSTNNTGPAKFHIFNTVSNLWSGPEIPITDTGSNPSQQPTEVHGSSSSSSSNLGAIIGGVVGGIALLAAVAFFVIRRRRRQNNSNSNGNNSNSGNPSNGNSASHTNTDYNDKDVRPTEKDARSPEGMPLPGKHPQFPVGAPPVNNYAYGYNYGHEGELGMPLAGSQVISSDPRYNNSAIYPTHTPANISQPSQESSRRPLQVFVDGNKAEINSSTTSDIIAAAPHSFGDKAELDSSSDVIVTPVRLYTPSPQVSPPHLVPARPPTHTYYSIAQDHAS